VVAADVFVAPSASVVGEVLMHNEVSVWYGAVVRGDKNKVKIGHCSSISDKCVINTVSSLPSGYGADVQIGDFVTIDKGAIITSSILGNTVQVGAGAIIEEGCVIEAGSIIAAGSVVKAGTMIKKGQFWAGNPAAYIRDVADEESKHFEKNAAMTYVSAKEHMEEYLPHGFAYADAESKQ
jgi:carbonic anhydrase/acetyltransferase-like protein (isoleucine patch superfamily)